MGGLGIRHQLSVVTQYTMIRTPAIVALGQALQHFFENPWILRAWVFQEAVCARVATVQCGSLKLDFDTLCLLAVIIYVNGLIPMLTSTESRGSHHQLTMLRSVRRRYARGD